jgi:hypothetical protein
MTACILEEVGRVKPDGSEVSERKESRTLYTVPVVLAIFVVFITLLIFWGAVSEQQRGAR